MNSANNDNRTGSPSAGREGAALNAGFDHERLDVYQLELRFITWVTPLLEAVANCGVGRTREVCDQLDRASLSALLNTAEGNGKRRRQVRAKFFDDARGSATECAACLDALVAKGQVKSARVREGKALLLRIISILCRLVDRFDDATALHEEDVSYIFDGGEPVVRDLGRSRTRTRTSTRTRTKRKAKV